MSDKEKNSLEKENIFNVLNYLSSNSDLMIDDIKRQLQLELLQNVLAFKAAPFDLNQLFSVENELGKQYLENIKQISESLFLLGLNEKALKEGYKNLNLKNIN